ncbi:MAG TPA: ABC transporter substrate-binding protein [Candidatus Binatia bacterium]|nr:ABC transporter substrate-binding protein [Candidatus Binatia bacterium]
MKCRTAMVGLFMHFLVFHIAQAWPAEPPTKLIFLHGAISSNVTPLWIGKDQGFFHKYGLDADLVFVIAGRAAQAMLAGQAALGLIGATHVANAVTAGGDLTMILGLQNKLDYLFIARPSVKNAEELKGKKVAIGTPSGSASLATYVALDYLGLVPRRDNIVLLQVGGVPERLAALRSGSVEATSLSPEFGQIVQSEGYRLLLDTGKENIPFQSSGLVTSRRFMKSDPHLAENMAKAIIEAAAYIHNPANRKVVEQTIAKYLRLEKPDQIERAYSDLRKELPRKPCPTLEGVASVLKLMAHHGLNSKAMQLKPEDVADMSLCRKLEESGFVDRLYRGF